MKSIETLALVIEFIEIFSFLKIMDKYVRSKINYRAGNKCVQNLSYTHFSKYSSSNTVIYLNTYTKTYSSSDSGQYTLVEVNGKLKVVRI